MNTENTVTGRASTLSHKPFALGYPSNNFLDKIALPSGAYHYSESSYLTAFSRLTNQQFPLNSISVHTCSQAILYSLLSVLPQDGTLLIPEPNLDIAIEIIQMTRPDVKVITVLCLDNSIEPLIQAFAKDAEIDAIYISCPNNPLGYVYDSDQLIALSKLAKAHNACLIVDQSMMFNNPFGIEIPLALNLSEDFSNCLVICDSSKLINHRFGKTAIVAGDARYLDLIRNNLFTGVFKKPLDQCSQIINFNFDPDCGISIDCRIKFYKLLSAVASDASYIAYLNQSIARNFQKLKAEFANHQAIEISEFQAGPFAMLNHKIPDLYPNILPENNLAGIIQLDCFFRDNNPVYRNYFRIPLNRTEEEFDYGLSLIVETLEANTPDGKKLVSDQNFNLQKAV